MGKTSNERQTAVPDHGDDLPIERARPAFFDAVYEVVARIPYGQVTTYGAIARALGAPRSARVVGWAMRAVPEGNDLACHRVVDREGRLSGGWHFGHPDIMAGRLHDEAIPFLEPYRVNLALCLWDPGEEPWLPADGDAQPKALTRSVNRDESRRSRPTLHG